MEGRIFSLLFLAIVHSTWALKEVPLVNVTLTGGPETRVLTLGENFELNCTFAIGRPKGELWKPQLTIYHNGAQMGRFERMEKNGKTSIYWNTVSLIPGVNLFAVTPVVPSFESTSSYVVQVQPLSFDAAGRYGCSVLLENEDFTKARYFSNPVDIRPPPFPGAPQGTRRQPPPPPPAQPTPQPTQEPKKDL